MSGKFKSSNNNRIQKNKLVSLGYKIKFVIKLNKKCHQKKITKK